MAAFLYRFGYESPRQLRNNDAHGWDDEDSQWLVIEADTEADALAWGHEVSERFLRLLFHDNTVSWRSRGYASTIESKGVASSDIQTVHVGHEPTFELWLSRHIGEL